MDESILYCAAGEMHQSASTAHLIVPVSIATIHRFAGSTITNKLGSEIDEGYLCDAAADAIL
ncbi:hypothetical protein M8C21_002547 [Ambrosia artemisiifolia]|uniref:Uncharacterized protein n=1 Tax=Ambrosia artemisiifolia TaxID=4212 RepID=A0AAD5BZH9_AMBAR|nr:hypothetical protein M8C21_002547 [Ambrosia artemisiifolia]